MLNFALAHLWRRMWLVSLLCAVAPQAAWARARLAAAVEQAEPTELTYVGYIADAHSPQVHVQTSEKTQARLERLAADHWVLHVPHAQIVRHVFSLAIDTSCFAGPVDRIEPEAQEEPDNGTVVNIHLRRHATLRMTQHGRNIFVDIIATARKAAKVGHHSPHDQS